VRLKNDERRVRRGDIAVVSERQIEETVRVKADECTVVTDLENLAIVGIPIGWVDTKKNAAGHGRNAEDGVHRPVCAVANQPRAEAADALTENDEPGGLNGHVVSSSAIGGNAGNASDAKCRIELAGGKYASLFQRFQARAESGSGRATK